MKNANSRLLLASELTVIAGFHNRTAFTERNVVSIIPHNKFNKTTFDNDIAVLKVCCTNVQKHTSFPANISQNIFAIPIAR
jgi:secreted trypsin-like serine protease